MNLEFSAEESPIVFQIEELSPVLRAIDERAIRRGQRYLISEAELLESIIEVDQHKLYEKFGFDYLTTYCVRRIGLDETVAGVLVRIARKSQIVPELKTAVVDGEISMSHARIVASVITKENQSVWIEKAKTLSKSKLEREVASVSPTKAKPEKVRNIGNGRVQIVLNLSEEEFDRRSRIKDLVSQNLRKSATESEVEVAMMDCYQFHKDPVRKAERAAKRKCKERDAPRDASELPQEANESNVSKAADLPNDEDSIPAAVKHIVNLRDRGACRGRHADGTICGSTRWVHFHHIISKSRGGLDVPENIITLCSSHHRLWHNREGS